MEATKILIGKIAVVAGGSRGCGRGIALALGDAGATVYVTGRTTIDGLQPLDGAPGTIEQTAEEVTARGGIGIPVPVDHTDSEQVRAVFARVVQEQGRLDVLACAVWGGNERYTDSVWHRPFWEQPASLWNEFLDAGPYAFWLAAHAAVPVMAKQRSGLMVAITEPVTDQFDEQHVSLHNTVAGLAHHSINKLVSTLAQDARKARITVVGLLADGTRSDAFAG